MESSSEYEPDWSRQGLRTMVRDEATALFKMIVWTQWLRPSVTVGVWSLTPPEQARLALLQCLPNMYVDQYCLSWISWTCSNRRKLNWKGRWAKRLVMWGISVMNHEESQLPRSRR